MERCVNVSERDDGFRLTYYCKHKGETHVTSIRDIQNQSRNKLPKHIQEAMALLDLNKSIEGVGQKLWPAILEQPILYIIKRK